MALFTLRNMKWVFLLSLFSVQAEEYRVVGVGAATIDFLAQVDDEFIEKNMPGKKGGSYPLDPLQVDVIIKKMAIHPKIVPGGSAANTLRALAKLGEHCAFLSCLGDDPMGEVFAENLDQYGITGLYEKPEGFHTAQILCLISPDGERTFCGHDQLVTDFRLDPEILQTAELIHFEERHLRNAEQVEEVMKHAPGKVSLSLSCTQTINEHKEFLIYLIENYVDILFGNEEEIQYLTDLSTEEGCLKLLEICPLVVGTRGAEGCIVAHDGAIFSCPALPAQVLDTTGAGDYFASGFLYGILNNYSLENCARLGNRMGGAIVEVIGTHLSEEKWKELQIQ